MRLLPSRRGPRDFGSPEGQPIGPPPLLAGDDFAGSEVIGARQERLGADLAEAAQLASRLQQLSPMIERLCDPLAAEFEAHRRDHSELLSLKVHVETLGASVKALRDAEQGLRRQVAEAGKADGAAREEIGQLRTALAEALSDRGGLQDELARTRDGAEDLRAELTTAQAGARQLEEDAGSLRARLAQAGERRRELDALSARARQDADLAEAENVTLRHRVDDLAEQLARMTRADAQAQADLVSERERAAGVVAEAERLQREAQAHAQAFESQLVAARAQVATLTTRAEGGAARNTKLERLCVELSAKANDAVSHRQHLENAANDSQAVLQRTLDRVEQLERTVADAKSAHVTVDRARLTALERADQLAAALHSNEALLQRAEGRVRALEESLQTLAVEEEGLRRLHEDDVARLNGDLRRMETDLQMQQAALKAAREHRGFAVAS